MSSSVTRDDQSRSHTVRYSGSADAVRNGTYARKANELCSEGAHSRKCAAKALI
jgi:hypothetical protein